MRRQTLVRFIVVIHETTLTFHPRCLPDSRGVLDWIYSRISLFFTVLSRTLEAVTKIAQDGNINAKDSIRHADALNQIKVLRTNQF